MHDDVASLIESRLGHRFNDRTILLMALTHASYRTPHNELLAWVGDRIHGVWAARVLATELPHATKGQLTEKAKLVIGEEAQAAVFDALDLEAHLRLGGAITGAGRWVTPAMKSTAFEALIAAIEADGGRDVAESFLDRLFGPVVREILP